MKPSFSQLKAGCPAITKELLRDHLDSLGERYFVSFEFSTICAHLNELGKLSQSAPVRLLLKQEADAAECTVLAFNYPGEFSLITGILAATGFEISTGNVFTYQSIPEHPGSGPSLRRIGKDNYRRKKSSAPERRRRIIDHFIGRVESGNFTLWRDELTEKMNEIFNLLEQKTSTSLIKAKRRVNEWAAERLAVLKLDTKAVLYPLHLEVDNSDRHCTRILVRTEDTPFFLSSFSTALSLRNISIEHVKITTSQNRIEDSFEFVDSKSGKKLSSTTVNDVKLSLLLTKQFTYFLGKAPNPYDALTRFENLIDQILKIPGQDRLIDLLSDPGIMIDLAKLLGTSDFLWEDFIRLQYENLIPMLTPGIRQNLSTPPETLAQALNDHLAGTSSYEEQKERLNKFKDSEIYRIDLDHILNSEYDFIKLSERLTLLAECVINTAIECTYSHLSKKYGIPGTVAGLEARYTIMGLGKLGGQALGYASDIEFLFVYSDSGATLPKNGTTHESISNAEFFEYLVRNASKMIDAKREGIFHVDLRLRPYGNDGPLACSLDSFCDYYGKNGNAHSYEKLALVRLRCIGGDRAFGAQVERLRDSMIYCTGSIKLDELKDLRDKQLAEKTKIGRINAKFSPGALVDLEYAVQILQVIHGEDNDELRTPSIHRALAGLEKADLIKPEETEQLVGAYHFLRQLINALRMLRGSAMDLFLPPRDTDEYVHLARRMGYFGKDSITPKTELYLDFEATAASVRVYLERHFGPDSSSRPSARNVADLVLSDLVPAEECMRILADFGNPKRALRNLRGIAGKGLRRAVFAKLAILAFDTILRQSDPDIALNNWERFTRMQPDPGFEDLLAQPQRLEILLSIFSGSQFLSDTLIRNPEFMEWITKADVLHRIRPVDEIVAELKMILRDSISHIDWLNNIRIYRRREILRIGTKDLCLRKSTPEIVEELSNLAEAIARESLEKIWINLESELGCLTDLRSCFCIVAFGKLGGRELNYSSDLDLLGIYSLPERVASDDTSDALDIYSRVMSNLSSDLSVHTEEGYAYRIDLRLRPYGRSGLLVHSTAGLYRYYAKSADLWEKQALLKIRPIAGNLTIGFDFIDSIRHLVAGYRRQEIVQSISTQRDSAIKTGANRSSGNMNIKNGLGGIRDVEFLIQGLQLQNLADHPELFCGNSLSALDLLTDLGIIRADISHQLKDDYLFLRVVEHYLQIREDQQTHSLPTEKAELNNLAKRLLGKESKTGELMQIVENCRQRIHSIRTALLYSNKP